MGVGGFLKDKDKGDEEDELSIKVLVVEDENYLRNVCSKKLTKEGFEVFEAIDGEMALHEILKTKPDIILLDIILPYMNGFEVIEKIRKSPNQDIANIPIVVMSNLGEKQDIKKAKELGANDYLVKSQFTVDEIIKKLKTTLKQ
jgi:DNA-binding response OmpR family regulator